MLVPSSLQPQRLLAITGLLLATANITNGYQTWHRRQHADIAHRRSVDIQERIEVGEKVSFGYFPSSNASEAEFRAGDIDTDSLTHILYSFAEVDPLTGILRLIDSFSDEQNQFNASSNASTTDTGNNLYGHLGELYQLKLQNRHLKVMLSIGGLGKADYFQFVTNTSARATFVSNATKFIRDYALDGIDLDYEFPTTEEEGQGFANLLTSLRDAFDLLQVTHEDETPYLLSAVVSSGTNSSAYYKIPQMNAALDYWNLLAYNYSGNWSTVSDNHANLFGGQSSGLSTDAGINWLISEGASPQKITLGIPLFGQTFENTTGLGEAFNATLSSNATFPLYKNLPYEGAVVFENLTDVSSYSFDEAKGQFISFDTPNIVELKAQYIENKGLAGSMFFDLSMDKSGNDSLVNVVAGRFKTLDSTANHIDYPDSKFDNVRDFMGMDCGSDTNTTDPSSSSNSTASTSSSISASSLPAFSSTMSRLVPSRTPSVPSSSRFSTVFVSSTRPSSSSQTGSNSAASTASDVLSASAQPSGPKSSTSQSDATSATPTASTSAFDTA